MSVNHTVISIMYRSFILMYVIVDPGSVYRSTTIAVYDANGSRLRTLETWTVI